MTDRDFRAIANSLKGHATLKVLDVSSNRDITSEAVLEIQNILENNRVIEYFGLSKLNLATEDVAPLFGLLGRFPFPEDQVENHLAELKKK